ncbi:MAG: DUF1501 domain-containing protein [Planctomycetota bacterium]|nr:DUF1501 domain-containing protein [Planctomycetota bacterium]
MSELTRRDMLRMAGMSLAGISMSGWMPRLAQVVAAEQKRQRHCVLLWMPGGATQTDTFDMKPNHANAGEFKEIATNVAGLRISEHLPKLAAQADKLAIVRSLSTAEGDHNRGTYLMHTGHRPGGPIRFPTMGSSISKAMGSGSAELPNFVSISPYTAFNNAAFGPGFLGPRHAPLTVGASNVFQQQTQQNQAGYAELGVDDLATPVGVEQADARLDLWNTLQTGFLEQHASASPISQDTVYRRAIRMMRSEAAKAFDLSTESETVRDAYGRGRFGQGCLMARRLIERGVPFVEISLRGNTGGALGWDTHAQNFPRVKALSTELDAGWATLMTELQERGLLERTTIIWLGEFGRTPVINRNQGRDHYPRAWTTVLAGGGIKGGQAYGRTSADGTTVEDKKVDVPDVLATLCRAIKVDPEQRNISEVGRPIRIAEGKAITEILS